jgi:DNA-binding Xre family transcriptional regulator
MNAEHYDHEKLAQLRQGKFTRAELADALQITEMTVHRAEAGKGVSYEVLFRICTLLGVDIRDILRVEPEKNFSSAA